MPRLVMYLDGPDIGAITRTLQTDNQRNKLGKVNYVDKRIAVTLAEIPARVWKADSAQVQARIIEALNRIERTTKLSLAQNCRKETVPGLNRLHLSQLFLNMDPQSHKDIEDIVCALRETLAIPATPTASPPQSPDPATDDGPVLPAAGSADPFPLPVDRVARPNLVTRDVGDRPTALTFAVSTSPLLGTVNLTRENTLHVANLVVLGDPNDIEQDSEIVLGKNVSLDDERQQLCAQGHVLAVFTRDPETKRYVDTHIDLLSVRMNRLGAALHANNDPIAASVRVIYDMYKNILLDVTRLSHEDVETMKTNVGCLYHLLRGESIQLVDQSIRFDASEAGEQNRKKLNSFPQDMSAAILRSASDTVAGHRRYYWLSRGLMVLGAVAALGACLNTTYPVLAVSADVALWTIRSGVAVALLGLIVAFIGRRMGEAKAIYDVARFWEKNPTLRAHSATSASKAVAQDPAEFLPPGPNATSPAMGLLGGDRAAVGTEAGRLATTGSPS